MVFQCGTNDFVGVDVTFLDHFAHIDVLDRVVVGVELEITPRAGKIRFFQRSAESISRFAVSNPCDA